MKHIKSTLLAVVAGVALLSFSTVASAESIECGPSGLGFDDKICIITTDVEFACFQSTIIAAQTAIGRLPALAEKACERSVNQHELTDIQLRTSKIVCERSVAQAKILCYRNPR